MILAIDLGGRSAKFAMYSEREDKIVHRSVMDTRGLMGQDVIEKMHDHFVKWCYEIELKRTEVKAIGFACVGPIDPEEGVSINAGGKFGWDYFPAKKTFESYFSQPMYMTNDARAAAIAELWKGAGKGLSEFLLYTLGTGVGGGIVIGEKIYSGAHNLANEFGHGGFIQDRKACGCGIATCLEGGASATGIEAYVQTYIKENPNSSLAKLQKTIDHPIEIKEFAHLFQSGDKGTVEAMREALKPLASHMSVVIYAFDPQAVIIGGGPSALGECLIDAIKYNLAKCTNKFMLDLVDVKLAKMGNDAGIYGALYTALRGYVDDVTRSVDPDIKEAIKK